MFEMHELVIPFIVVWIVDFCWSILIIVFALKYKRLGINEFFHKFIVIFLVTAYYTRITEMILIIKERHKQEFNRDFGHNKRYEFLLVYAPLLFHGLTGFAYLFRWSSYLVFTTAKCELQEALITKRLNILKMVFLGVWSVMLCFLAVMTLGKFHYAIFSVTMILFYIATAISLVVICNIFLQILKKHRFTAYKAKKFTIRWYTTTIAVCLWFRSISEAFDISMQGTLASRPEGVQKIIDLIILSNYFTEIIPSLLINYVLWRSYQEAKMSKSLGSSKNTFCDTHAVYKQGIGNTLEVSKYTNTKDQSNDTSWRDRSSHLLSKVTDSYEQIISEQGLEEAKLEDDSMNLPSPLTYY